MTRWPFKCVVSYLKMSNGKCVLPGEEYAKFNDVMLEVHEDTELFVYCRCFPAYASSDSSPVGAVAIPFSALN